MVTTSKTIVIDLLCWSSVIRLFSLIKGASVEAVYYLQCTRTLFPLAGFLENWLKVPLRQITQIIEAEESINGASYYQLVHEKVTRALDTLASSRLSTEEARRHGYNTDKFGAYIREVAFSLLFRPIELSVLAQKYGPNNVFLLKRTPLAAFLSENFEAQRLEFYSACTINGILVKKRPTYFYDRMQTGYYASRWWFILKSLVWSLVACLEALLRPVKNAASQGEFKIGVELSQKEINLDMMNDIYWLKDSGIDLSTVCGLEEERFDEASRKVLQEEGIATYKITLGLPDRIRNYFRDRKSQYPPRPVFVDRRFLGRALSNIGKLLAFGFRWNEQDWLKFHRTLFSLRTAYWQNIYEQLGIKMLWTMYDTHTDKLTKAQAVENRGGLYMGGHWSNFPMFKTENQKCYDVIFTWGEHFIRNNFDRYPHLAVLPVGYPCDHYFDVWRTKANELRRGFPPSAFVLSYMDNVMANDLPYSMDMQVAVYKMLIELLRKYDTLYVMLKSKRRHVFEELTGKFPEIQDWIKNGRIRPIWGESAKMKAVPAYVGMASDLVVGLGISTTAAECFFAGTVSFHADLTGFRNNAFGNKGEGKIVFRDVESLKNAIVNRINGTDRQTHEDHKPYYETLDPFQDGKSFRRIGFIMRQLQDALKQGLSREAAVQRVKEEYAVFTRSPREFETAHKH